MKTEHHRFRNSIGLMIASLSVVLAVSLGLPCLSAFAEGGNVVSSEQHTSASSQNESSKSPSSDMTDQSNQSDSPSTVDQSSGDESAPADSNADDSSSDAGQTPSTIDTGTFFVTSALSGHRVLDMTSGSTAPKTKVQLYARNETPAQQFIVEDLGEGSYAFKNVKSGLYLAYPSDTQKFSDLPSIVQVDRAADGFGISWHVFATDGGYRISPSVDDDYSLDIAGGSDADHAAIRLYRANGTKAQLFTFELSKREIMSRLAADHEGDLSDGTYLFRSSKNNHQAIDVASGSKSSGANIQLYALNGSAAQLWKVSHDDNGFVTLKSNVSGLVLDVNGGNSSSGTNVQQYASNGSLAQKWVAVKDESGNYKFVSALDPYVCLDLSSGSTSNGTNIQIWSDNGSSAQRWSVMDLTQARSDLDTLASQNQSLVPDGRYIIALQVASKRALDVASGSKDDGANVRSYVSNMTLAQRWDISHDANGYLIIKNAQSGKVLDVSGGSLAAGTNIEQYASNGTRAQRWIATPGSIEGTFVLRSALYPDLVFDVSGGSGSSGANVQTYWSNGTAAQSVRFISLKPQVDPCDDLQLDGWFTVSPARDTSKVFDIASGSTSNGANVQLFGANGTFAQDYSFEYHDGYYLIVSAQSGKALDVDGGNLCPGTNVQQWDAGKGNSNQLFSAVKNDDGSYSFINKASGLALCVKGSNVETAVPSSSSEQRFNLTKKVSLLPEGYYAIAASSNTSAVLDVASGSTSDGANVQIYGSNRTLAQKWRIAKVADRDNTYTIESLLSGKVLTADGSGNVCVRGRSNSDSQYWTAEIGNGKVILSNVANGKVLDISGGSTNNGANVQTYKANGTAAQSFKLVGCSSFEAGAYTVLLASARSKALDVSSGSRSNGANIQIWDSNGSGAQKWYVTANSDGTYSFQNCRSKKYLDVLNAQGASGANVQQWQGNGSVAQRWRVEYTGNGGFAIRSALNPSLVLDVSGGSTANGANVQIYAANGSAAQSYTFAQTSYSPEPVNLAVPVYNQYSVGLPNGCESAALTNVLNYYGFGIGPCEMADRWIPRSSYDFVWHFWGDPHSYSNGNEICAPGLTQSANNFLASRGSRLRAYDVSGTSLYDLCKYLDDGNPVIIWTTVHQQNIGNIYARSGNYFACSNSHTVVLKGYDPQTNKVMLSDTIDGYTTWDRGWIAWVYQRRGAQAVVIK